MKLLYEKIKGDAEASPFFVACNVTTLLFCMTEEKIALFLY